MKKADIYKELKNLFCTIISGRITSSFSFGLLCIIASVILLFVIPDFDMETIIGCAVLFIFGCWLLRSVLKDYKEKYRREAIKEEQRRKGLRD